MYALCNDKKKPRSVQFYKLEKLSSFLFGKKQKKLQTTYCTHETMYFAIESTKKNICIRNTIRGTPP